jgi:hypothetical protein
MTEHIDFQAIKDRVTITQAVEYLGLQMKRERDAYRSACPACKSGDDRQLVVTPAKSAYYCFSQKRGGDQIALVAHVRGCSQRAAAKMLQDHFSIEPHQTTASPGTVKPSNPGSEMKPLDYLETDHPAIEALGLTPGACEALGAGYAPKGTMVGRVLIPIRTASGTLAGYLGIATTETQQPLLLFPKNLEERCKGEPGEPPVETVKAPADQLRKLFRVVG